MAQLFVNNGYSTLSAAISTGDTTLFIAAGHGSRFPVVVAPDFCFVTLEDASGNIEIVKVTAHSSGSTALTIARAQQGTTARSYAIGDLVELRSTAAEMTTWEADIDGLQASRVLKAGDSYTGAHDFSGASGVTLPAATSIGPVSATEIGYLDGLTSAIQSQLNAKADITGETYSGSHDFSGASSVMAPTKDPGSTGNHVATVDYANALSFASTLPGMTGNSLKVLRVNAGETSAEWARVDAFGGRSPRTSNSTLGIADVGKLIDITSGTFSQAFAAASTLGPNWACYLRNSGTGDITLDPNGSELIDGLTSYVMYPGETRLVTCDGSGFYSIVLTSFYRVFTATGTFYCPPGYNRIQGLIWGGGGGGAGGYGGNGGSCVEFDLRASDFAASQTLTVGSGGAAGADGGASSVLTISSGAASKGSASEGQAGSTAYGRNYLTGPMPPHRLSAAVNFATPIISDYGGGVGTNSAGTLLNRSHSIYGGGGGAPSGSGGASVFGGAGAVGAGNGTAPGGAGGSTGAGARGEIRVWGVI